jgi:hypothetical protein
MKMAQTCRIGKKATTVTKSSAGVEVVLYSTKIVEQHGGQITLRTGGWKTATTRGRMVQASNQFSLGYNVFQKAGEWFVTWKGKTLPFEGTEITLA